MDALKKDRQRNLAYNINSSRFRNFSVDAIDLINFSLDIFLRIIRILYLSNLKSMFRRKNIKEKFAECWEIICERDHKVREPTINSFTDSLFRISVKL